MAKVIVILNCTMDNGKEKKGPGEAVSLEKKEAADLVKKGFASYPMAALPQGKDESTVKKASGKDDSGNMDEFANPDALDPNAPDQGGEE